MRSGLIACFLMVALLGTGERVQANVMVPFLEAASGADAIVLARLVDSDASELRFSIVETYRGKVSGELVKIPTNLWPYVSQRFPDNDLKRAQFLFLVNADGSLRCGHMGDVVILCGTCLGVIPVIGGAVPEADRRSMGPGSPGIMSLEQVKAVLVGKRGGG